MLQRATVLTCIICCASLAACTGVPSHADDDGGHVEASPLPDIGVIVDAPIPDVGVAHIGESCRRGCVSGLSCLSELPAGGTCTKKCTADGDCGSGFRCIGDDGTAQPPAGATAGDGKCYPRCNVRSIVEPCRDGYICRIAGQSGYCAPDCRLSSCGAGLTCDSTSGLCIDGSSGHIGQLCGKDVGTCDGTPNGVCLALGSFSLPFCTIPCAPFTKPCPTSLPGAACVLGAATSAYCAFVCDPDAPSCPSPDLTCEKFSSNLAICTPKKAP